MQMLKSFIVFILRLSFLLLFEVNCNGQIEDLRQKQADSLFDNNQFSLSAGLFIDLYNATSQLNEQKANNALKGAISLKNNRSLDSALQWFEFAMNDYNKLKLREGYYLSGYHYASTLDDVGRYAKAISIGEENFTYFKESKDSSRLIGQAVNLALFYYHGGEIEKSLKTYAEAIEIIGDKNDASKAKCYNQLGNIWAVDLGNEEKALEYYQKSLQLKLQSSATAKSISFAYNNIGISHKNLNRLDSAIYYYGLAEEFAQKSNEPGVQLNPLINIANLQKRKGDLDAAAKTYNRALVIAENSNIKTRATLEINVAMLYNELKNYQLALKHLSSAEEFTNVTSILIDKRDIVLQKAVAYHGLQNFQKAYENQLLATSLNDSLYAREREQQIADIMLRYEAAEKDKALLEQSLTLQKNNLTLQKRTTWLIIVIGLVLLIAFVSYFLFKRKEALAKQVALESRIAEEKERTHIQEERLRISRELHDNIGSYLTLINASFEEMPKISAKGMDGKYHELKRILSLSMSELRKTVWLLNNQEIAIELFALRLRDFFKPLNRNETKIIVKVEGDGEFTLTDIQATHLFRIIQEAVNNSYKYACPKNVHIQLVVGKQNALHFSVKDDGYGFDTSAVQHGNGLNNMKSRVAELKGKLFIESAVGQGTLVSGSF